MVTSGISSWMLPWGSWDQDERILFPEGGRAGRTGGACGASVDREQREGRRHAPPCQTSWGHLRLVSGRVEPIRDNRIALEACPTSNLQTGAAKDYATHPIDLLRRLGFRITLNTDNRLVSGTTMSQEYQHMVDAFGYGPEVFEKFTVAAVESAFLTLPERRRLIDEVIRPGYAALGG